MTFFGAVVVCVTEVVGTLLVCLGAADVETAVLLAAEVVTVFEATTTGSVEGIGFPSLVCNFNT